ncbi:hypothetical protein GS436_02100 [Rhodococcus hoagii]|nr:hypothetical protein [Prescottella equi]
MSRDDALFAELKSRLLEHKVLFFRDQDMSRAEHVALRAAVRRARGSPRRRKRSEHPGLVRIYKDSTAPRSVRERLPL